MDRCSGRATLHTASGDVSQPALCKFLRRTEMSKRNHDSTTTAQPRLHQRAGEIQAYGSVNHALPLELEEPVRLEMTEQLNQLLADTMTLRDLYKKSHWQVAGP